MSLPVGVLARGSFDFEGTAVPIRSLSRKEVLHFHTFAGDLDKAEAYILECGTDSTAEEVEQFRTTWSAPRVDDLVEAISHLSGLYAEGDKSKGAGPKASRRRKS